MKKIISLLFISGLIFSFPNGFIGAQEGSNDMLHFVMTVKWGNVRGEMTDKSKTNFDGSISVSANGKASLIRTLRFDNHNESADKITSKANPISWNSLIFGHWDGVRVLISSPANENVTVTTTQGAIIKTAKEFYELNEPYVEDTGNGKEILIKTHPAPQRAFIAKIIWGKTDRNDYLAVPRDCDEIISQTLGADNSIASRPLKCRAFPKEKFSGSLTVDASMKLLRTLRWEKHDKIVSQNSSEINWESFIFGGVDGILVRFNLDKDINKDSQITLSFPGQDWAESISLLKIYHEGHIKKQIKEGYGVFISVWQHPDRRLIRAKDDYKVYIMEDGLKRHIPNPRVFEDQALNWNDVEVVEPDEVEVLPEDDALSYTEGTLIQGEGPEVYAISNDEKRHIKNPAVFTKLKYNWQNIIKVDNQELGLYPTGSSLDETSNHPDSTLVKVGDKPTVYVVEGDKLKPITSIEAFDSHNYRWGRVKVISQELKNEYKTATSLKLGNGALVRSPSGKIYSIDQDKKRWIRTADDLKKAGFKESRIIDVTNEEINEIEEGEDVVADDLE